MTNFEAIGNAWKHPKTGEVRYYVNDAWKYGGLELDFYKSGNICSAKYKGEKISHAEGGRMASCVSKCWITEDGEVHFNGWSEDRAEFLTAIVEGIKNALKEVA